MPNPGEGGPVAPDSNSNIPATPTTPATPGPSVSIPATPTTPAMPGPSVSIPATPTTPAMPGPSISVPAIPTTPAMPGPSVSIPATPTTPAMPWPNPGSIVLPIFPKHAKVRFLNAAYGYRPFRVLMNNRRMVNWLGYAALSPYSKVPAGYQTVSVTDMDGYVYIQKDLPFQANQSMTIAIINTANGLDLMQIPDNCCVPNGNYSNFRVSNLAFNSPPLDVLLGDGRVVYGDVHFKETTAFKRIHPGAYQFFFAETTLTPMPRWMDIETLDSAALGAYPVPDTLASLYLNAVSNTNYTVFLIPSGPNSIQAMLTETR